MNKNESFANARINWYPGHMAKTKRQIQEDLKLIDIVIEILDARIPTSSQNPDIGTITKGKKRIVVLNKSDLADEEQNKKWITYFNKNGIPAVQCNANTGEGIKEILKLAENIMKEELEKQAKVGRVGKPIRIMILGIPNVGKSSLINKMIRKNTMQVGNKPGVTRQKQWVKVSNKIELLDTPGILWPKFQNQEIALNLSYIGTIKDENLQITEIAYRLLQYLCKNYPENLKQRYKLESIDNMSIIELMELIARKRGAIKSANSVDDEKVARIIIEDYRSGRIGKITIEKCE